MIQVNQMQASLAYTTRSLLSTSAVTTVLAVMVAAAISALVDAKIIAAASCAAFAALLFYRYPLLLLALFASVSALDSVFPSAALLRFAGIKFLPADPVYAFMIVHLGLCAIRRPRVMLAAFRENVFLVCFAALVVVSVLVYTPLHGQSAVGEARKFYFMFLFPLIAAVSIRRPEDVKRLLVVLIGVATMISAVALGNAASTRSVVRAVNGEGALIIALGALSMLVLRVKGAVLVNPVIDKGLLGLFWALAVGAAHRTVWITIAVGVIAILWLYRTRAAVFGRIAIFTTVILSAAACVTVYLPGVTARLADKFAGLVDPQSDKNASWRMEGWRQQLERFRNGNLVFGEGVGGYYSWKFEGNIQRTTPHNAYIQLLLKFGLLGLGIYLLIAVRFFRRMAAVRKLLDSGWMKSCAEVGLLSTVAAHGYTVGYGFEPVILCYFGLGMTAAVLSKNTRRSEVTVYDTRSGSYSTA